MSVTIASTYTATDRSTNTITLTATPPSASGTVAFLFVAIMKATTPPVLSGVTCKLSGGSPTNMTAVYAQTWETNNRYFNWGLYKLEDPIEALGSGEHVFAVTTTNSAIMAITAVYVTGATEIRPAQGVTDDSTSINLPLTNEFTPSLILAGGWARTESNPTTQYATTAPTGDTVGLAKSITGYNANTDLIAFAGYASAEEIDTYDLGWVWSSGPPCAVIAVEIVGEYEPAALGLAAVAPTVILGDILIEDLTAALGLAASIGETSLGSIPPVQVIGRGNLYFATNARNLTAILLGTTGDKWTIATAGGATEQLGCTIIRRKGYITPR